MPGYTTSLAIPHIRELYHIPGYTTSLAIPHIRELYHIPGYTTSLAIPHIRELYHIPGLKDSRLERETFAFKLIVLIEIPSRFFEFGTLILKFT